MKNVEFFDEQEDDSVVIKEDKPLGKVIWRYVLIIFIVLFFVLIFSFLFRGSNNLENQNPILNEEKDDFLLE